MARALPLLWLVPRPCPEAPKVPAYLSGMGLGGDRHRDRHGEIVEGQSCLSLGNGPGLEALCGSAGGGWGGVLAPCGGALELVLNDFLLPTCRGRTPSRWRTGRAQPRSWDCLL